MILDRVLAHSLPYIPKTVVRKVANRYIAGETLDEALDVGAGLNRKECATLGVLASTFTVSTSPPRRFTYLQVLGTFTPASLTRMFPSS